MFNLEKREIMVDFFFKLTCSRWIETYLDVDYMLTLNITFEIVYKSTHKFNDSFTRFSDIDECLSNPCQNGATCNNEQNGYTCRCAGGWQGTNCDIGNCSHLSKAFFLND
jgi:hypothetical protein